MTNLKAKPFALIGVNREGIEAKKLREVMDKEKLNWRSFADQGEITAQWNSPGTPGYYVVDHKGMIRHKWMGGTPGPKALEEKLEKLIEEAERRR